MGGTTVRLEWVFSELSVTFAIVFETGWFSLLGLTMDTARAFAISRLVHGLETTCFPDRSFMTWSQTKLPCNWKIIIIMGAAMGTVAGSDYTYERTSFPFHCLLVYHTTYCKHNNQSSLSVTELGLGDPRQGWKGVFLMTSSYSANHDKTSWSSLGRGCAGRPRIRSSATAWLT